MKEPGFEHTTPGSWVVDRKKNIKRFFFFKNCSPPALSTHACLLSGVITFTDPFMLDPCPLSSRAESSPVRPLASALGSWSPSLFTATSEAITMLVCVCLWRLFTDRLPGQPTPCTCVVSAYLDSSEQMTKQFNPPVYSMLLFIQLVWNFRIALKLIRPYLSVMAW